MEALFTFRGHRVGVTALDQAHRYLITGDEEGSIIIWDVETYKSIRAYSRIITSRIQSVRAISKGDGHGIIVQSRDNGLYMYDLLCSSVGDDISIVEKDKFPSCPNLFSKGDTIVHRDNSILLGYASEHSCQIVTIRNLSYDWKELASLDLERPVVGGNVFDIRLRVQTNDHDEITCFIGYEDGKIAIFTSRLNHFNDRHLTIMMTRLINVKIQDFVSAFDISRNVQLIIGSPTRDLIIFDCDSGCESKLTLDRRGISSIKCHWTYDWVAVARWDSRIDIYSIDTKQLLYRLNSHSKQVQDMIWLNDISYFPNYNKVLGCASSDGTISLIGF